MFYAGDNCPLGVDISVELCSSVGDYHNERLKLKCKHAANLQEWSTGSLKQDSLF